jgi:hypothetical protein
LLVFVVGVGLAFALASHGRSHLARATPMALQTPQSTAQSQVVSHVHLVSPRHVQGQTQTPRHHSRPRGHLPVHAHAVTAAIARANGLRSATTIAATKTTPKRTVSQKPRIVTISDNFNGTVIDTAVWYQFYEGSGWAMSQHDGHLEFLFPPGTAPEVVFWQNYGGHVGTRCVFPGDFDARVDFRLAQWPAANSIVASLQAFFKISPPPIGSNLAWAATRSSTPQLGEQYSAYLGRGQQGSESLSGSVSLNDLTGTLRLTRRNDLVTAYFLHKGKWQSFGSARNASPAAIGVGAESVSNPPVRSDQVVVDFDNFSVTGPNPTCPPGSNS